MGAIAVILIAIAITKASIAPFTHDESYTYLNFTHNSFIDIISLKDGFTNNHLLNTLFIKYFEMIFGNSELALRAPNILALGMFLFFMYKFSLKSTTPISLSLLILCACSIPVFDIFTLARGYGLSIAFMTGSFFYLIQYLQNPKKSLIYAYHIFALLGALSNFTILLYYASSLLIILLFPVFSSIPTNFKHTLIKEIKANIRPVILSFIMLYEPIRRVKGQQFDFGGKNSFFNSSLQSFFEPYTHGILISNEAKIALSWVIISLLMLSCYRVLVHLKEHEYTSLKNELTISTSLVLIMILAMVIQHALLKTDYPIGRFALFLVPLFVLNIFFLLLSTFRSKAYVFGATLFIGMAVIGLVNFGRQFSFNSHQEWKYDMNTPLMLEMLYSEWSSENQPTQKVNLGIDWFFEPSINYYRIRNDLQWLNPVTRNDFSDEYDYLYFENKTKQNLNGLTLKAIHQFKETNTQLAKVVSP